MEVSFSRLWKLQVGWVWRKHSKISFPDLQGDNFKQRHCEYNLLQDIWAVGG